MAACAVARCLNVHESTISRLRSRHPETNSTHNRSRTDMPRVTSPAQDSHIRLCHLRNCQLTAASMTREIPGTHNPRISKHTVRLRLREAGARSAQRTQQTFCWTFALLNDCSQRPFAERKQTTNWSVCYSEQRWRRPQGLFPNAKLLYIAPDYGR